MGTELATSKSTTAGGASAKPPTELATSKSTTAGVAIAKPPTELAASKSTTAGGASAQPPIELANSKSSTAANSGCNNVAPPPQDLPRRRIELFVTDDQLLALRLLGLYEN